MANARSPKMGSAPSDSILKGAYNQTYIICKRDTMEEENSKEDSGDNDYQERRVMFRCGNWCYTGNITLDASILTLGDLPKAIPALQKQQNRLHYYCNASSVPRESPFYDCLSYINAGTEFFARELGCDDILAEVARRAKEDTWIEDDAKNTYFELQANQVPKYMHQVALAASKTYCRGLIFITAYFESRFYAVICDGEGDQPLLDVKFPDVSRPGGGVHLRDYYDDYTKLTLWHSLTHTIVTDSKETVSSLQKQTEKKKKRTTNLSSQSYVQMYIILRAIADEPDKPPITPHHDVLFRFGSWCYSGSVQLTPELDLGSVPHIIPALRMQQARLDFLCDVNQMPTNSPFTKSMAYLCRIAPLVEIELAKAEDTLQKLILQLAAVDLGGTIATWLEGDGNRSFFEFQLEPSEKDIQSHFRNVEMVATKSYGAAGVVLISVLFNNTLYVTVADNATEQPLLDSKFPEVATKGRGYLIASYPDGVQGWPELRKLSVWQSSIALEAEAMIADDKLTAQLIEESDLMNNEEQDEVTMNVTTNNSSVNAQTTQLKCPFSGADLSTSKKKGGCPFAHSIIAAAQNRSSIDTNEAKKVARPTVKEVQDDPTAKDDDADTIVTNKNDHTFENLRAQPKDSHPLLRASGMLGTSGTKVNAPHRIPSVSALNERLAKVRAELDASGAAAPWDHTGRPRSLGGLRK
uniref:Uncharacterized protein n=1 Tax=Aureoumbra lagunensis TaxID=44058 RepID=A0A7S3NQS8_9STRA|eukprot:CAMPEP_0197318862 /NCGR_PEP_ID=MMETSP0891-20130614/52727_1 /TAXON_ID=44058 ORGANISM="Aureoumbra lagunensis, Strain CCMP1510" /NCGR_SAMPLE_ID=MMETSP0891 /ASSEMBLY_ACC=CAM_ASM_000534 /LENGTH=693 /DNA_ID=CAMNT_0042809503 /DNA_START=16 /DNA_END=2097 /DNA_ORIENTATION=+